MRDLMTQPREETGVMGVIVLLVIVLFVAVVVVVVPVVVVQWGRPSGYRRRRRTAVLVMMTDQPLMMRSSRRAPRMASITAPWPSWVSRRNSRMSRSSSSVYFANRAWPF